MSTVDSSWDAALRQVGERYRGWRYVSDWIPVTQSAITAFAHSVDDPDPMHIDLEWSRANTTFGGTIAQGLWTAAILVKVLHDSGLPGVLHAELDAPIGLNYGFDRLRLIEPVSVGSSIRGILEFKSIEPKDHRTALIRLRAEVATDRAERPALVADWIIALQR